MDKHPTMFTDGRIGSIYGTSFLRTHVYVKTSPKWFPSRLWYKIAGIFTATFTEDEDTGEVSNG